MRRIPVLALTLAAALFAAWACLAQALPSAGAPGWRLDDTAGSFVSRLRDAARPLGNACQADEAKLEALAASLTVSAPARTAVAGKPFAVDWRAASAAGLPPAWLILAADAPVRFSGSGFYALMPEAIAPFGLGAAHTQTRAFVALSGADAPRAGSVGIVPLVAGRLRVSVVAAGFLRRCGRQWTAGVASAEVTVSAAPDPAFFVRDPFSFERPQRILLSPSGAATVEVYDGRYRLIEQGTGAVLADRNGRAPNFSPTGRFLLAESADGFDMLDTVDGALVATLGPGDIGWENRDSFAIHGLPGMGEVDAVAPLAEGFRIGDPAAMLDCRACAGREAGFRIDLENDVAHGLGALAWFAQRLSGARARAGGDLPASFDADPLAPGRDAIAAFVATETWAVPPSFPRFWDMRGGPRFGALEPTYDAAGRDEAVAGWDRVLKDHLVHAAEAPREAPAAATALVVSEIGRARSAVTLSRPKTRPDTMMKRLEEFGIRPDTPEPPVFTRSAPPDPAADEPIAARIEAAVPTAKGLFEGGGDSFVCYPEDDKGERKLDARGRPKIFSRFDKAVEYRIGARELWLTQYSCLYGNSAEFRPNFYLFDSAAPTGVAALDGDNPLTEDAGFCPGDIAFCAIDARLYAGRLLLVWSQPSRAILLHDVDARKTLFRQFDLPRGDLFKEAFLSEDGHVVQVGTDGSFFVYDVPSGARVLEGRYVDDETVAWTPDLRFDASPEGANYVNLRFPGRKGQYTFQQFSRAVRRPGLVQDVLSRRYAPAAAGGIGVPPQLGGEIEAAGSRIRGRLAPGGAAEVRVYQDGLHTDTLAVRAGGQALALDVARLPGTRWVSLVAADRAGLVSLPVGRNLFRPGDPLPVVHALTVGVDAYENIPDLRFAARDARTLADALKAQDGRSLRLGIAANLADAQATPEAIIAKAREIVAAARPGETVVLSFAGHGATGPDGRFFMATGATDPRDFAATALSWEKLSAVLARAQARVVVFLDACHSGAAGTGFFATNDDAAGDVLGAIPSGLVVFSASKGRQFSEEAAGLGGGVFTNAVADVIARDRSRYDLDGDGLIEVSELYAGVKRRVSDLTDGRQVPWLARNEMVGDFALF